MTADRTGAEVTIKGGIHRDFQKFNLIRQQRQPAIATMRRCNSETKITTRRQQPPSGRAKVGK